MQIPVHFTEYPTSVNRAAPQPLPYPSRIRGLPGNSRMLLPQALTSAQPSPTYLGPMLRERCMSASDLAER